MVKVNAKVRYETARLSGGVMVDLVTGLAPIGRNGGVVLEEANRVRLMRGLPSNHAADLDAGKISANTPSTARDDLANGFIVHAGFPASVKPTRARLDAKDERDVRDAHGRPRRRSDGQERRALQERCALCSPRRVTHGWFAKRELRLSHAALCTDKSPGIGGT